MKSKIPFRAGMIPGMALAALILIVSACSTTKKLGEHDILYNGIKSFKVNAAESDRLPAQMVSDLKEAVNVKPACPVPFLSPYVTNPVPAGLWIYNAMSDSAKGVKGWFFRMFARRPVLISNVKPDMRTKMMEQIMANNGYFGSTADYSLTYNKKNEKIARINYEVNIGKPYIVDTIIYLPKSDLPINAFIDSVAKRSGCIKVGDTFCVDSMMSQRVKIANSLRNRGYYYFRPEYIEYLADSTITPHRIALKLTMADNVPPMALKKYRTGNITTLVLRRSRRNPGVPDTIHSNRGDIVVMRPSHLRRNLIPSCITFREGKLFSVRDMDRTQTRLSRLGIFGTVEIQPVPGDTASAEPTLDVLITCKFDNPWEASVEVNATSKSNSYIGPGLIFGLTNHNAFGGGEKFNMQLTGSYEWQTGRNRGSVFNSYEIGLTTSLAFPRLLAPKFMKASRRELPWTTISLGIDLLNRPHYFKMAEFNAGITYEWRATRHVLNQFTPFKLSYTKLMHTTHEFDSIMAQNPAVALSFQSQFIPQMSYTYTYDRFFERERINGINFTASVMEAGNIFDLIWKAAGQKGRKKLFGTPFSQFVKGQVQLVYNRRLVRGADQWLVSRVLIGAAHAYGNSSEVPYAEQFYIGGANSIRAFTVRSIGPGSYRSPKGDRDGYFDQTGTFKFELNTEYRFPIVSVLHGAVFLDAGNIWLLKEDPNRPGGKITGKNFFRDLALGTGIGLRVDIGMMVIRGDLGYGLHTPYSNGTPHYFNVAFKKAFAFHLAIGYPF